MNSKDIKIGVVYFSKTDITAKLIDAFVEGVTENSHLEIIKHRVIVKI